MGRKRARDEAKDAQKAHLASRLRVEERLHDARRWARARRGAQAVDRCVTRVLSFSTSTNIGL